MKSLLVHGCYDSPTLNTLKNQGISEFSFDLRGHSSNMVPFRILQELLRELSTERIFLTFENDKKETILSMLNLLKDSNISFQLLFRDSQSRSYYETLGHPFYWMFSPGNVWKEILRAENLRGVFLPLKFQLLYQDNLDLWALIEERSIDVYLHADSFSETASLDIDPEMKLSVDLNREVEKGFRTVDQERLKHMQLWRRYHESATGQ